MGFPITSDQQEWATPWPLFNQLNEEFRFDLDPAAADWNHKCDDYFTMEEDGLTERWYGSVFLNPPYGRQIKDWIKKAYQEWLKKASQEIKRTAVDSVVALLPARTDPQWFHQFIYNRATIRFLPGRIYFIHEDGSTGRSPWGSMVVVWE